MGRACADAAEARCEELRWQEVRAQWHVVRLKSLRL